MIHFRLNNYGYGVHPQATGNVVVVPQQPHPSHFAAVASAAHRAVETAADATADGGGGCGVDMSTYQVANNCANQHLLPGGSIGSRTSEHIYGCKPQNQNNL